jgi:hypothetical protein
LACDKVFPAFLDLPICLSSAWYVSCWKFYQLTVHHSSRVPFFPWLSPFLFCCSKIIKESTWTWTLIPDCRKRTRTHHVFESSVSL